MGNNVRFDNQGPAVNLLVFAYGYHDGTHRIDFRNQGTFKGGLYAPRSYVYFNSSGTVVGAIAADRLGFKNTMTFTWDPSLANVTQPSGW